MNDLRIEFSPKYLPILDPFKAKHDIRYYLCGIYVEKAPQGGLFIVACDGHTLAVVHDVSGVIEGRDNAIFSVDSGLVAAAKKGVIKSNSKMEYRVMVHGTRAMVAVPNADGMELFLQPGKCLIEGNYPKWRTVLPKDFSKLKSGALADEGVNAIYLARFAKLVSDRFQAIFLWQEPEAGKPVIVQVQTLPEAIFVVMPMRNGGNVKAFDVFATKVEEPAAVAATA